MAIERFPGAVVTPRLLFAKHLDEAADFTAAVTIVRLADGTWSARWSNMENGDLCAAAVLLQSVAASKLIVNDGGGR